MSFKPGDFFLGVVNFLGVLVPGAALMLMQSPHVLPIFGEQQSLTDWLGGSATHWLVFGGAAYVVGELLLALTEWLNYCASPVAGKMFHTLHEDVVILGKRAAPLLIPEMAKDVGALFHAAVSYVRLENVEAASEIDRHMADYKLLRNLVGVFSVDLLVSMVWGLGRPCDPQVYLRLALDIGLAALSFISFVRMYCWAQLLAFEYSLLINRNKPAPSPHSAAWE